MIRTLTPCREQFPLILNGENSFWRTRRYETEGTLASSNPAWVVCHVFSGLSVSQYQGILWGDNEYRRFLLLVFPKSH